jgi:hypothetical protein
MRRCGFVIASILLVAAPVSAQTFVDADNTVAIDPERGADEKVDYASLIRFGPWDDRNYELTADDLGLLAPGEEALSEPIPAFFRVVMRREWPELPREGEPQYPRSALQIFRQMYGGYLVNGKLYRKATRSGEAFALIMDGGMDAAAFDEGAEFVSGESRITSPNGAAESAIAVSPADPNNVVAGTNGPGSGQKMHYSRNGGETWTQVELPLGGTCCDPSVDWSSDGTYAYTSALGNCGGAGCAIYFYRSDDDGRTWDSLGRQTPRTVIAASGSDKEYIHVDRYSGSPYQDNIYVAWHQSNVQYFAVSTDFGRTFTTQSFSGTTSNRGIGSDITTDHNGHVYYIWPGTNSRTIRLAKSTNGGVTFSSPSIVASTNAGYDFPIPSFETRRVFIHVSADADLTGGTYNGSIYAAWTDTLGAESSTPANNHARVQVAYSRDGGATWDVTTPHETDDIASVDRWHPWLTVGSDGTVHVIFYDTRRDPTRTSVDLFYSFSAGGAMQWSDPIRVTTEMSPNIADSFEYGDYSGLDIVMSDLIAIFTDNRDESGGSNESVDVYAAGITPGEGPFCGDNTIDPSETCDGADLGGLSCVDFACSGGVLSCLSDCSAFDTLTCSGCGAGRVPDGDVVPGVPLTVDKSGPNLLLVSWSTACGSASDYAIYEGAIGDFTSHRQRECTTSGATSISLGPSSGNRYYLVTPSNTAGREGSYGTDSAGVERVPAFNACYPQEIGVCQ